MAHCEDSYSVQTLHTVKTLTLCRLYPLCRLCPLSWLWLCADSDEHCSFGPPCRLRLCVGRLCPLCRLTLCVGRLCPLCRLRLCVGRLCPLCRLRLCVGRLCLLCNSRNKEILCFASQDNDVACVVFREKVKIDGKRKPYLYHAELNKVSLCTMYRVVLLDNGFNPVWNYFFILIPGMG